MVWCDGESVDVSMCDPEITDDGVRGHAAGYLLLLIL